MGSTRNSSATTVALYGPTDPRLWAPRWPDWANDKHTAKGCKLGRGLDHFRSEGAKLVPPAATDAYEGEAYRLLKLKEQCTSGRAALFDE